MKKRMYKRWLALFLAMAMCVTLIPSVSLAATYRIDTKRPASQDSERILIQQVIEETLQETATGVHPLDTDHYAPEVVSEINKIYSEALEYVRTHPDAAEIYDGYLFLSEELAEMLESLELLADLDRNAYAGSDDNKELKKLAQSQYDDIVSEVKRSDYNDWYWDLYVQKRNSAKQKIDAIHDLESYIEACREPLYVAFPEEEDDGGWVIFFGDEDNGDTLEGFLLEKGIDTFTIVKRELIQEAIEVGQEELDEMIDKAKRDKLFTPSKSLTSAVKGFTKAASAQEDINVIVEVQQKIKDRYKSEYEAAVKARRAKDTSARLSDSDLIRWSLKMLREVNSYKRSEYSAGAYENLRELYEEYAGRLKECGTQNEAQKLWNEYVTELKKIPKEPAEVKAARTKCIKAWKKKYHNKEKYNQKKVRKVLPKGIKALKRATTMEAFDAAKQVYTGKLDNTIYRFTVKVKKTGQGKVTKSKKLKYGEKYKLKITPAAGHALKSVTINGKAQKLKYSYKIKIKKDTVIRVRFQ